MTKYRPNNLVLFCLIILEVFVGGQRSARAQKMSPPSLNHPKSTEKVAAANDAFTVQLHHALTQKDQNFVMSGFSLSSVVAMAGEGAAGNTKKEIQKAFRFPQNKNDLLEGFSDVSRVTREEASGGNFTLNVANTIYVHQDFKLLSSYVDSIKKHFLAEAQNIDFGQSEQSLKVINKWVEDKTHEKIKNLLPKGTITPLTRVVLVNAVYFKGDWEQKFDKKNTQKEKFFVTPKKSVNVDMMHADGNKYMLEMVDELDSNVLIMPYKGDRIEMLIILPKDDKIAVESVEEKLSSFDLSKLRFESSKVKLNLSIPKFEVESTHELLPVMQKMGVKDMFNLDAADFSGMTGDKSLSVSAVVQKAFIKVNEEGSEAAAATGMVMMMRSMPMPPMEFKVNRPFLFMIKDKLTGLVLFSGKISDPSA